MTIATRKPTVHQLRRFFNAIRDGIPTNRAADSVGLDQTIADEPRMANAIRIAEANALKRWHATVNTAGEGYSVTETGWSAPADASSHASPRTRAWSKVDWRATAFLLERRFPAEYGAQQPQQVASAVVDVLHALAALRDQPAQLAVHQPRALADGKQEHARAREGS